MTTLTVKSPPQAIEIEEAVLGAMLTDKDCLVVALAEISNAEIFYSESHKEIYNCCVSLFAVLKPVDTITIINELRTRGTLQNCGGVAKISELGDKSEAWQNIKHHIVILKQKWIRRLILKISQNNIQLANDEMFDEFELIEKASFELLKLNEQLSIKQIEKGKSVYLNAFKEISKAMQTPGMTGLSTGISEIDKITGGWQSPDLIIVAGRPGMGKTAFALSVIKNIFTIENKSVLFFSLEMTATQLMSRYISMDGFISGAKLKKGYLNDFEYTNLQTATQHLYNDNIKIDDSTGLSIGQLRAKAVSEKVKDKNLSLIVVDYLQLMKGGKNSGNREREISEISAGLKNLAKELKIPIIALAQLSRATESRVVKKPQLSDIRESGSIEQDADIVIFINRPEYYGIENYEDGSSTKGTSEIIIAKNRHGGTSEVIIGFNAERFKFHSFGELEEKKSLINSVENNFDINIKTGEVTPF